MPTNPTSEAETAKDMEALGNEILYIHHFVEFIQQNYAYKERADLLRTTDSYLTGLIWNAAFDAATLAVCRITDKKSPDRITIWPFIKDDTQKKKELQTKADKFRGYRDHRIAHNLRNSTMLQFDTPVAAGNELIEIRDLLVTIYNKIDGAPWKLETSSVPIEPKLFHLVKRFKSGIELEGYLMSKFPELSDYSDNAWRCGLTEIYKAKRFDDFLNIMGPMIEIKDDTQ